MSEKLLELGGGLELWKVAIDDLREQDENARVMPQAMFDRLQKTVERDERLESLPLCAVTERGIEIVSGHHRIRAARAAGLSEAHILVDVTGLTEDQIRAKQLAHNAISGEDNEQVLARIYGKIRDVDARLESFIDPKVVEAAIEKARSVSVDLLLDYRVVVITFLPTEYDRFCAAAQKVQRHMSKDVVEAWLASIDGIEKFRDAALRAGKKYDVRAMGSILDLMADIVSQHLDELEETIEETGGEEL